MSQFEPCNLKRHEEGDSVAFQAKLTGAGVNDMCNMQELTKDTILNLLKDRFRKEIVYTYVGDIIVSVNPFKNVGAVGKAIRSRYKKGGAQNAQLLMPHCYHLVTSTFDQMMTEQKSQSVLISGESGAGKTEAMKICLTLIGEISTPKGGVRGKVDPKAAADPTAARLMQTNPVMEAIGNAKTVRNDNSSRFGKHFDIQFDDKGACCAALRIPQACAMPRRASLAHPLCSLSLSLSLVCVCRVVSCCVLAAILVPPRRRLHRHPPLPPSASALRRFRPPPLPPSAASAAPPPPPLGRHFW